MKRPPGLCIVKECPPAFTLIELLVVLAILGILVVLILSAVRGVTEQSKATQCASQLRTLGTAVASYQADHQGEFPAAVGGYYPQLDWGGVWYSPVVPQKPDGLGLAAYTGGVDALYQLTVCPLNHNPDVSPPCVHPVGYPYVVNYYLMPSNPFLIARNVQVAEPSKMIVMMDSLNDKLWGLGVTGNLDAQGGYRIREAHFGKANILWADGHVSASKRSDIQYSNIFRPDARP